MASAAAAKRASGIFARPGSAGADSGLAPGSWAQVLEDTVVAARPARVAHPTAVRDEEVRGAGPVGPWHKPREVGLDLDGVVGAGRPEPLRETPDVGVDDDALGVAELRGDDVRGLARDTREPHEILELVRDLAVELLEQHLHRASNRLRLLAAEAGRVARPLELLSWHGEVVLGSPVLA